MSSYYLDSGELDNTIWQFDQESCESDMHLLKLLSKLLHQELETVPANLQKKA